MDNWLLLWYRLIDHQNHEKSSFLEFKYLPNYQTACQLLLFYLKPLLDGRLQKLPNIHSPPTTGQTATKGIVYFAHLEVFTVLRNHAHRKGNFQNGQEQNNAIPIPGIEPEPPGWKPGILATRPYGILDDVSCRNPGSNQGPLDLQSNALPTELFRHIQLSNKTRLVQGQASYQKIGVVLPQFKQNQAVVSNETCEYIDSRCSKKKPGLICIWLIGLVVWFSLRVREVPGSIPGWALRKRYHFDFEVMND